MALRIKLADHLCHRAQRLPLEAPLAFRIIGGDWHTGTTVNVSRSGLLFEAKLVEPPGTFVECKIFLTNELRKRIIPHILGEVVRVCALGSAFRAAVNILKSDIDS